MLEQILSDGLGALSIPFTDQTLSDFRKYYTLLSEYSSRMNLTAISGEEDVARLHFLDCASVLSFLDTDGKQLLDIGSGAGFPGLVLKILCPSLNLTLLDSQQKRVGFQMEVCNALGFRDVRCLHLRAEEAPAEMREHYGIVISRAVARLNILSELCVPFVRMGGVFCAMKGPAAQEELSESEGALRKLGSPEPRLLRYSVPGLDAERTLVIAEKACHTPSCYPRRFAQIKKQPL